MKKLFSTLIKIINSFNFYTFTLTWITALLINIPYVETMLTNSLNEINFFSYPLFTWIVNNEKTIFQLSYIFLFIHFFVALLTILSAKTNTYHYELRKIWGKMFIIYAHFALFIHILSKFIPIFHLTTTTDITNFFYLICFLMHWLNMLLLFFIILGYFLPKKQ